MNLLPTTLSATLKREIGQVNSPEQLMGVLRKNPKNLLQFFHQACAKRSYIASRADLIQAIWIEITNLVLSQTLDCRAIGRVYALFNGKFKILLPGDLVVTAEEGFYKYSRIVFMRDCSVLRARWINNPKEQNVSLKDFAGRLTSLYEVGILYEIMLSGDYFVLTLLSSESVFRLILQTNDWGAKSVNETLQTFYCSRIVSYHTALCMFATSLTNNFEIILKHSQKFLDETLFFKENNHFSHFSLALQDYFAFREFVEKDLNQLAEDYLRNLDKPIARRVPLKLEWINLVNQNGMLLISYGVSEQSFVIMSKTIGKLHLAKEKIDKNSIKKIIFSGASPLKDIAAIGLLRYFENLEDVMFADYKCIHEDLIPILARVKSNIRNLTFSHCNLKDVHYFELILMTQLDSLSIIGEKISEKGFGIIMELSSIKCVSFIVCDIILPASFPFLSWSVTSLAFREIASLSLEDYRRLLLNCDKLKELSCINCAHFSLQACAYPERLEELCLSCETLDKEIDAQGNLFILEKFKSLKKLSLIGKCGDKTKNAIRPYFNKFNITIRSV